MQNGPYSSPVSGLVFRGRKPSFASLDSPVMHNYHCVKMLHPLARAVRALFWQGRGCIIYKIYITEKQFIYSFNSAVCFKKTPGYERGFPLVWIGHWLTSSRSHATCWEALMRSLHIYLYQKRLMEVLSVDSSFCKEWKNTDFRDRRRKWIRNLKRHEEKALLTSAMRREM